MKKQFTIFVYTENNIGLLSRLSNIFSRRHVNIDSITCSESEIKGVHRFTIVVEMELDKVQKIVKQIDKQIEVLKAISFENEKVVYQEVALYKIPASVFSSGKEIEHIVRAHFARVLSVHSDYVIIEKTGHEKETTELFEALSLYGLTGFVRSGRIALPKSMESLQDYIKELEPTFNIN